MIDETRDTIKQQNESEVNVKLLDHPDHDWMYCHNCNEDYLLPEDAERCPMCNSDMLT